MAQRPSDVTGMPGGEEITTRTGEDQLSAADETTQQTEQIRAKIEETRAEMGETIDAIQERLSLANISEQVSEQVNNAIETAKDTVYVATVGKAVDFMKNTVIKNTGRIMKNTGRDISNSAFVGTVKENPFPFILIGLGAGLLAYQGFSKRGGSGAGMRQRSNRYGGQGNGRSLMSRAQSGLQNVTGTVSDAAGSTYEGASRIAGSAIDSVSHLAETARTGAGSLANRTREMAGDLGSKAQETYSQYLEEKPWAIGAVALAAGAAIGMAIPSTRYEGELMGEARMNLLNKVQESANGLIDQAKQAATDAGQTLKEQAQDLAENALS